MVEQRELLETVRDGIIAVDTDGCVAFANAAAISLLRSRGTTLIGSALCEVFPPALADEIVRCRDHVATLETGDLVPGHTLEVRVHPGDRDRVVLLRDVTMTAHGPRALALLADVSAVIQRPLDLRERLDGIATALVPRLADLVLLDVFDVLDGARILRHVVRQNCNAHAIETLEASAPTRPTARGVSNVVRTRRPEIITHVTDEWMHDAAQSESHFRAGKALAPQSLMMVPMIARNRVVGVLSLVSLDPQRRYSEEDLPLVNGIADRAAHAIDNASLYEAAVAARKRRDEVLGMVSHDLRGLLHAIELNALLIPARDSLVVKTIRTVVTHANRLVDDLLAVTELESGQFSVSMASHPISSLVDQVLELSGAAARAKRIELVATGDSARADVDEHRIVQALTNLVGNAIKFGPSGSRVTVCTQQRGEYCLIQVRDEGPGIAPEQLTHIFDRFWRGVGSKSRGLGLGLTIAKGTVEAHGGHIDVDSTPGAGSCFSVWIPTRDQVTPVARSQ